MIPYLRRRRIAPPQRDGKRRADLFLAVNVNRPTMGFNNFMNNRHPQTNPLFLCGEKWFKNSLGLPRPIQQGAHDPLSFSYEQSL